MEHPYAVTEMSHSTTQPSVSSTFAEAEHRPDDSLILYGVQWACRVH